MSINNTTLFNNSQKIARSFDLSEKIVVSSGNCLDMLKSVPDETFQLIVTSPPYNIGKEYEKKL